MPSGVGEQGRLRGKKQKHQTPSPAYETEIPLQTPGVSCTFAKLSPGILWRQSSIYRGMGEVVFHIENAWTFVPGPQLHKKSSSVTCSLSMRREIQGPRLSGKSRKKKEMPSHFAKESKPMEAKGNKQLFLNLWSPMSLHAFPSCLLC